MSRQPFFCAFYQLNFTAMKNPFLLTAGFLMLCFSTLLPAQTLEVYVSDAGNFDQPPWQILKFDADGQNGEVFISDHLAWPQDIFFLESEQTVLISNLNSGVISRFNAASGEYINDFATGIGGPTRMKPGPDGLLYVLQWQGNGKVKRYNLDGTFVDDFTQTGVNNSIGLDWDAAGNLYVSSFNGKNVRKFSPTGEDLGIFIGSDLSGPTNIWFGSNGDLLVADWNAGVVKRFDSQGNYLGILLTGVPQAEGVDFFPNGDIAIGSGQESSVKVYDPEGNFIKELVPAGTLGLLTPNAVVFRNAGSTSTKEVNKTFTFLTPAVGVRFNVATEEISTEKFYGEVFDSSGIFARRIDLRSPVWDASGLAGGIYFVTAVLTNGSHVRQKIIIQH